MAPKKKGGKKKGKGGGKKKGGASSAPMVIDGKSTEDMTIEELRDVLDKMRAENDREREERNYFQLERDKINTFWEITKQQLDEKNCELKNKEREMEDAEERHQIEIKVYKQKVKHLLYNHQETVAQLRAHNNVQLKLAEEHHSHKDVELRHDKKNLKLDKHEQQLANEDIIKNFKFNYEEEIISVRSQFGRHANEIIEKYEKKMNTQNYELTLRRKNEVHEVEERKNMHINDLMKQHERAFSDIKNYYNDIALNNLALINTLKDQVNETSKKKDALEKHMNEVIAENRRLVEPLRIAESLNSELKRQMVNYQKDKQSLRHCRARIKQLDNDRADLEREHEVLENDFDNIQGERDDLYNKFVKAIHEVQQKSGLKNVLLERKLMSLAENLDKKDAQLNEVLSASNLDPSALNIVSKKLEDVLNVKNSAIKDLQYELARVCKAHNDLLSTYEIKLKSFGIPVEELGFKLLSSTISGHELGQGPAGLVSAPP